MNLPFFPICEFDVLIPTGEAELEGEVTLPARATGLVIFAHGSGSSRPSLRNRLIAAEINRHRIATLLVDLLTPEEARSHAEADLALLTRRLIAATRWVQQEDAISRLPVGYFGSGKGAAAALVAAAELPEIRSVVTRGGLTSAAGDRIANLRAATCLIAAELDEAVAQENVETCRQLICPKRFTTIRGATCLFSEPGAMEEVADLASRWFRDHFHAAPRRCEAVMP